MGRFNMCVFDVVFHICIAVFHNLVSEKLEFAINCLHKRNIDKLLYLVTIYFSWLVRNVWPFIVMLKLIIRK